MADADPLTLDRVIEALTLFLGRQVYLNRTEVVFLLDQLRRLKEYDQAELRYSRGRSGASVTDCIGWIYLQKRQCEAGPLLGDMTSNMEGRMFQAVIDHLQELHGRREAADRAKAEERKRREAEEKARQEETKARENGYREFWRERMDREFENAFYKGFWESANQKRGRQEQPRQPPPPGSGQKWFEVLGVSITATRDQIQRAYRKLATKYHPDKPGGSHERMRDINAARDEGLAGLRV
jgi:DnaJ-domain-containing protein 1